MWFFQYIVGPVIFELRQFEDAVPSSVAGTGLLILANVLPVASLIKQQGPII
jgi:hypothetical protein